MIYIWKVLESNHGVVCPEYGYTYVDLSLQTNVDNIPCHLPQNRSSFIVHVHHVCHCVRKAHSKYVKCKTIKTEVLKCYSFSISPIANIRTV